MSAHFKWYPSSEEVVVPWNARYSFPSQANKAIKITPRIPPKNGSSFTPGNIIRIEFPAQGYVNPINTTFEFDVTLTSGGNAATNVAPATDIVRTFFQNNIQSIFSRVRLMYGSTPLEDIINYNQIVRNLTEWTATHGSLLDQTSVTEGIGNRHWGGNTNATQAFGYQKSRLSRIQGICTSGLGTATVVGPPIIPAIYPTFQVVPAGSTTTASNSVASCTRRYQVNVALGLLMQEKLIPVKFMASQLAIEFTLEQSANCIISQVYTSGAATQTALTVSPSYTITNFNMIPEILEFDSSYDAMFLKGLQDGGVPIKFSSWHTFLFGTGGSATMNLQVQERSRSVKALFACLQRGAGSFYFDNGATLFDASQVTNNTMLSYQWRIGGRYFPAQPVEVGTGTSAAGTIYGGCEAYIELQKALNIVGDYRLSTSVNSIRWGQAPDSTATTATSGVTAVTGPTFGFLGETDGTYSLRTNSVYGSYTGTIPATYTMDNIQLSGEGSSQMYCSAIDLETSNGVEISGLNAEEQSDIAFIAKWTAGQSSSAVINVFCYYDSMLILRENNVLELIQ